MDNYFSWEDSHLREKNYDNYNYNYNYYDYSTFPMYFDWYCYYKKFNINDWQERTNDKILKKKKPFLHKL